MPRVFMVKSNYQNAYLLLSNYIKMPLNEIFNLLYFKYTLQIPITFGLVSILKDILLIVFNIINMIINLYLLNTHST